uniref:Uncharacterized protein n=1 Tax=Photinus pyralis TaxID=7054 RepID=A0A1Y1K5I4_PHOPY
MAGVYNRDVKTAPFVNSDAVPHCFGGNCEHGGIVAHKDDSSSRRHGCLNNANNVWDGQAVEKRPHGKILEPSRGGRELVAESIVLHVNADQVVQPRSREAQNTRDFLGVEQVGSLIPMNPHASQIVAQEVVKGVTG